MQLITLIGSDVDAFGHPSECTEPAPGTVDTVNGSDVNVNGTDVYTTKSADMVIPSHDHSFAPLPGCHDSQEHAIDPTETHNVTVNGETMYIESDTGIDPGTDESVEFVNTGGNDSVFINK